MDIINQKYSNDICNLIQNYIIEINISELKYRY